jgi:Spy/CpxP family protein refolding chaperone
MNRLMRWRMIGYMAALFVAGVVTGAAVMARTAAGSQTLKVGRSEEIASLIRERCALLDLTHDQKDKFEPWILKASQDLEKSHLDCLQQCSKAVDTLYAQIEKELTPEQKENLKQLEAERRATLKKKYNYPPDGSPAGVP